MKDAFPSIISALLLSCWLVGVPFYGWAASAPSKATNIASPEDETVDQYLKACLGKVIPPQCEQLTKKAVEILKEDALTLGATAEREYVPLLMRVLEKREAELRIAAIHAVGMIGPRDSDADALAPVTNDPVPDVRRAMADLLTAQKGNAFALLKQRVVVMRTGLTPDQPADAAKFSMPLMPGSAYLFDSSDATKGRLSYVARGKSDPGQFFKAKAKKGPYQWDQFKELYRYQLRDEDEALDQAQQAAGKKLENEKPPDPATNMEAYVAYMQKLGSVSTQGSAARIGFDAYQSNLYGTPTVYVLEERQIGQRSYPTKYAVVYQELAFKRPGYRLAWTTVPDDALKAAQVASLKEQREEEALKASSKKEEEAAKKREAELDSLTKKKDTAEKKQFKKGQSDLEKELGF
jgi:HEAT repeat protein